MSPRSLQPQKDESSSATTTTKNAFIYYAAVEPDKDEYNQLYRYDLTDNTKLENPKFSS